MPVFLSDLLPVGVRIVAAGFRRATFTNSRVPNLSFGYRAASRKTPYKLLEERGKKGSDFFPLDSDSESDDSSWFGVEV